MLDHHDKSVPSQQHARNLEDLVYATWDKKKPLANNPKAVEQLGNRIASHLIMEPHGEAFSIRNALPTIKPEQVETAILTFLEEAPKALLGTPWTTTYAGPLEHPAMTGIVAFIGAISKDPVASPTVHALLTSGRWNPDPLWFALAETLTQQAEMFGASTRWELYPFWRFTAMMGQYAIGTSWTPNKNGVSDNMWHVTPFHKHDHVATLETMATKMPWSAGPALQYYQLTELKEEAVVPVVSAILGMNFAESEAKFCLEMLLEMTYDHGIDQSYDVLLKCFQEKYPGLATAVSFQASLLSEVSEAAAAVPALFSSWEHEIHGKAIDQMALPELSFERP